MGREFELKYRAEAAVLQALEAEYAPLERLEMETVYFDTPTGALSRRKWMLRLRKENGVSAATLKTPLPDGSRGEWEAPADDPAQAVAALLARGCPKELAELAREGLSPRCAARFTRRVKRLDVPGGAVELALDQGRLTAGARWAPICEIEVEAKAGGDGACRAFGNALAARFRLEPEPGSKAQRAFALLREGENTNGAF